MRLLNPQAQPQCNIYSYSIIGEEEAETLYGDSREPGSAVRCCGSEEPSAVDLVGMAEEVIKAVLRGCTVKGPLPKPQLCVQVWALGVTKHRYSRVQGIQSVAVGAAVDGTDQVPGGL